MFKPTQNIDTAFRAMRLLMLLVVSGSVCVSLYALYQNAVLSANAQEKVYVLSNGRAAEVFAVSRRENIAVEARDHVARFHELFFSLDPDEKAIANTIRKALYLSDGSAKKQYDDLAESGYIAGVISGNVSQQITVDSVQVNTTMEPFAFRCYATLLIIRSTSSVTRSLITQGYLRSVARSDHNPHGFLIEKWETLENKDLKIEER
ncbi:MAG: conjugative transposon protein TraK [Sediminibacterium magnilacihabitans]|jgi:conjugative transposon TraK protein|nr:conjugative transposon protein TraK [Sediminibacterium magnilacihabitans]PQV60413.1 conjugative transposon TraK protein [Sediminibacterium magnilacihabitans]